MAPLTRRDALRESLTAALALTGAASAGTILPSVSAADSGEFLEFTDKSVRQLRLGTEFLLKTAHRDGGCGVDIGQPPDIGCTAMVGLALLSQGNTPVEGPRAGDVRRMTSYLLRAVETMPADDITSAQQTQIQRKIGRHAHSFFAAVFLAQVVGEGWDPGPVKQALSRLTQVIVNSQSKDGDWGTDAWAPVLGTTMGWVSLRAAHFAGMKVGSTPERTAEALAKAMKQNLGNEGSWMHTLYKNATGVRVLYAMGRDQDEVSRQAFVEVLKLVNQDNTAFTQAGGEEYLAFHLITETMLQKGGQDWRSWFPTIRDKIGNVQNADGSWTGHHCITSRTFCTAAACLVLSAPNRFLPISQP